MSPEIARTQMQFELDSKEMKLKFLDVVSEEISSIAESRKLWVNRGKRVRDGVFLDLQSGTNQIFDTNTWQIKSKFESLNDLTIRRDKAGLIMRIGELTEDNTKQIEANLDTVFDVLTHYSPVLVIENRKKLDEEEAKLRKKLMRDIGFVQTNTVRLPEQGLVLWEGRMEKRKKPHPPIDLINSKSNFWLEKEYQSIVKTLKAAGYFIKGTREEQEIWKELKATKMPHLAISGLRNGFGLKLIRTKCYVCEWEIDKSGTETQTNFCGDKDCVGISPLKDLDEAKGRLHSVFNLKERKTIDNYCGHCGSNLEVNYRLVREDKFESHIQEITNCSHCGKPSLVKNHHVHPDQVTGREAIPYHKKP